MRILSDGKVGIGTTSPLTKFVVSNGGASGIEFQPEVVTDTNGITHYDRTASAYMNLRTDALSQQFLISGSEKMRLDSSGNLLIGKTANAIGGAGVVIRNAGEIFSTREGDVAGFNRLSSDGNIVQFYKDGSVVGAIGCNSSGGNPVLDIASSSSTSLMRFLTSGSERMRITSAGAIQFNSYGSGTHTGTATKFLAVDSSGNVIEEATSTIDGSGTAGKIVKWSDADTIGDSILSESGTAITITSTAPEFLFSETGSSITNRIYGDSGNLHIDVDNGASSSGNLKILNQGSTFAMFKGSSGALGLGTTSPDYKLEVESTSDADLVSIKSTATANNTQMRLGISGDDSVISGTGGSTGNLVFKTYGSERLRVTGAGLVGIGTTSPGGNLHVVGATGGAGQIYLSDADNGTGTGDALLISKSGTNAFVYNRDDGQMSFGTNDTSNMLVITNTGNLGLGTATPDDFDGDSRDFVIRKGVNGTNPMVGMTIAGDGDQATSGKGSIRFADGTSGDSRYAGAIEYSHATNDMNFRTNASVTMTLDDAGRLGLGTTSPHDKLHVVGNVFIEDSSPEITFETTGSSHSNWQIACQENIDDGFEISVGSEDATGHDDTFTPVLSLKKTGNVGIGITPNERLDLQTSSGDCRIRLDAPASSDTEIKFFNDGSAQYTIGHDDATDNFVIGGANVDAPLVSVNKSGNVGIGTSSPTGYKLVVENTSEDLLKLHNSTDGLDSLISFTNSGGTLGRIQGIDNGGLAFDTGDNAGGINTNAMFIDNAGNVGIGTTAPDGQLHVKGATNKTLKLDPTFSSGTYTTLAFARNGTDKWRVFHPSDDSYLSFYNENTSSHQLTLASNSNVGIGVVSPSQKLNINGVGGSPATSGTTQNGIVRIQNTSNNNTLDIGQVAGSPYGTWLQATDRSDLANTYPLMLQPTGGLVGIGTVAPTHCLSVDAEDGDVAVFQGSRNFGLKFVETSVDSGLSQFQIIGNNSASSYNALHLRSAVGTGLVIDTSNNVIIGGDAYGDNGAVSIGSDVDDGAGQIVFDRATSLNTSIAIDFQNAGTSSGSISFNSSTTAYATSSDYRLKEDYKDFNALEIASNIKMYDFKWKDEDKRSYGVKAHELQDILPDAVTGEKDGEEMQGVDYSKLVPILLKSIQELEARVKELEKEI